jgi:spermidine/putrescine transport system permease protein
MSATLQQPRPKGGRRDWLLTLVAGLTYLFLFAPILVLIAFSFNQSRLGAQWTGFTLDWYARLMGNKQILEAAANSLQIALISTLVSTFLGTLVAFAIHRLRFLGRRVIEGGLYIPIILPEIVMGISLLSLFSLLGVKPGSLTVILSHITFSLSFVYVTVRARLHDFRHDLERAAQDLGADEWITFWWVTFPLVSPGIVAGALLAFTLSLDDLIITFFTSGPGAQTLPIRIYNMVRQGVSPEINALSTGFMAITLTLVVLSEWLQRRSRVS